MLGQRRLRRLINDPADGDRNEQQEGHTDEIPFCNVFTVGVTARGAIDDPVTQHIPPHPEARHRADDTWDNERHPPTVKVDQHTRDDSGAGIAETAKNTVHGENLAGIPCCAADEPRDTNRMIDRPKNTDPGECQKQRQICRHQTADNRR